jgi:hypothetical protein
MGLLVIIWERERVFVWWILCELCVCLVVWSERKRGKGQKKKHAPFFLCLFRSPFSPQEIGERIKGKRKECYKWHFTKSLGYVRRKNYLPRVNIKLSCIGVRQNMESLCLQLSSCNSSHWLLLAVMLNFV